MSKNKSTTRKIVAFLKQLWGGISFVLGFIALLLGFIELVKANLGQSTIILLSVGIGFLWLSCIYHIWFWKPKLKDKSIRTVNRSFDKYVKVQKAKQRRIKTVRRLAILGLFTIPLLTIAGFNGWNYYQSLPPKNFIILVAKFEGSQAQNYPVTEMIVENLEDATKEYSRVKIESLDKSFQDANTAREQGKQKKAAIVIWGGYEKTKEPLPINVNFEVLKPPSQSPKLERKAQVKIQTLTVAELESFKLQTRLSQEMPYLSLFTLGIYRYLDGNWDEAINRFSKALEEVEEPWSALKQQVVYFYRGTSSAFKKDYKSAIADFTKSIKLNPNLAEAYYHRGLVYAEQNNYQQAIADYDRAIKLDPKLALAYYHRGLVYAEQK